MGGIWGGLSLLEQQHTAAIPQLQPEKTPLFIPNSAFVFFPIWTAVFKHQFASSPRAPCASDTVHEWVRAHGAIHWKRGRAPATSPVAWTHPWKGHSDPRRRSSISRWQTAARDRCKNSWLPWHNPERGNCCLKQNTLCSNKGFKKIYFNTCESHFIHR